MLRESLPEYLCVAGYCVAFRKDSSWIGAGPDACLGYPAALMLFAIVDAIGSYHRADPNFRVTVDDKSVPIRKSGTQHFYILNSEYYGQALPEHIYR